MLITKFNRMIRNKLLWGGFAVVISVMFVGTFSPTKGGCTTGKSDARSIGKLFGEPVSPEEFNMARFFELQMREKTSLTPQAAEALRLRTWKRLAALRMVAKMGITVRDEEVAEVIHRDPSFSNNGIFSNDKYKAFVRSQLRVPIETFESYLREELLLRKLSAILEAEIWTAPLELNEKLSNLTDSFVLETCMLNASNLVGKVTVSDTEAQDFFESNEEFFKIPEKINVKYVSFPISNYLADASVSDDDIREYYDTHSEDYTTEGTNGVTESTPLDDVKNDIEENLKYKAATYKAKDAATEFVLALVPDRDGNTADMEKIAASNHLTIATSAFFAAREKVPDIEVGLDFNRAAFELDPSDSARNYSDPIIGSNAVYVIALNRKTDARMPDYEEVADCVMPFAKRNAQQKAFLAKTKQFRDSVEKAIDSGKTFTSAAVSLGLSVTTTMPFTVYESGTSISNEIPNYSEILPQILPLKKGDLADTVEVKDGAMLVYVKDRTPGDLMSMETLRPQLLTTLSRYRAGVLLKDWSTYVLSKAGFTNTVAEAVAGREEEPPEPNVPSADDL